MGYDKSYQSLQFHQLRVIYSEIYLKIHTEAPRCLQGDSRDYLYFLKILRYS